MDLVYIGESIEILFAHDSCPNVMPFAPRPSSRCRRSARATAPPSMERSTSVCSTRGSELRLSGRWTTQALW